MSIVQPDIYSFRKSDPVYIYGEPITTFGFENRGVINGFGLVSRGLLWQAFDIWYDNEFYNPLTTIWSAMAGASITTTWSPAYGSSIATTSWSPVKFGIWGDYFP